MRIFLLSGTAIFSLTGATSAAIVLSPSRADLAAEDLILWEQLPISPDGFEDIEQPFTVTSNLGMPVDVAVLGAPTEVSVLTFNQGDVWRGNFNDGERLIYSFDINGGPVGPISLDFGTPISRVGFNMQPFFGGPFMGHIEAFDVSDASLGIFSANGESTGDGDGSALFLGISNDIANIKSIVISVSGGGATNVAINQVSLSTRVPLTSIPEPSSVLVLSGLLAGGFLTIRKRKSA